MNLDQVRGLASDEQGLCVASVVGDDGMPHASVVNAGMVAHPGHRRDIVGFVTRGGSVKHRRLRAHPFAALTFRRGWRWAGVAGHVDLLGPDDHISQLDVDVAELLREIFIAAEARTTTGTSMTASWRLSAVSRSWCTPNGSRAPCRAEQGVDNRPCPSPPRQPDVARAAQFHV